MNKTNTPRREFLAGAIGMAAVTSAYAQPQIQREPGVKLRLGLNAYSFDKPLRAGSITLHNVLQFCAKNRVDALDATGYYFPGYPAIPPDAYIYGLKRAALENGIQLSGTGVRNDFAATDKTSRERDIAMVKHWVEVAAKLGAPVLRVFSGPNRPKDKTFDQVLEWMIPAFQECAEHAGRFGVVLGLQQHNDFLLTAEETIGVITAVNSPWFADILDIGSLRQGDPYGEIEKLIPFAVSWQLKESVYYGAKETPTNLAKIRASIEKIGYRGVLPFEALGQGDPTPRILSFLAQIRKTFAL